MKQTLLCFAFLALFPQFAFSSPLKKKDFPCEGIPFFGVDFSIKADGKVYMNYSRLRAGGDADIWQENYSLLVVPNEFFAEIEASGSHGFWSVCLDKEANGAKVLALEKE